VTLTFDLYTKKHTQHIYEPRYIGYCEVPFIGFKVRCSQGYGDAQTHKLTHGRTHPKTECLRHRTFSMEGV